MQQRNSRAVARTEKALTDYADYTDLECKQDKGFSPICVICVICGHFLMSLRPRTLRCKTLLGEY